MTESVAAECVHRWMVDADRAVRLPREEAARHPNCIGRNAQCKGCGAKTVVKERVWDSAWTQ